MDNFSIESNLMSFLLDAVLTSGLEIRLCKEPRAPLNSPAAPNFCRESKGVLFDIHNTFMKLMKMQFGYLDKKTLNFEPWM